MDPTRPFDTLGAVDTGRASAVARAINGMLRPRFPSGWNAAFIEEAFAHVGDAYAGRVPGLLACVTPYHDLRHALECALATARLIDGWEDFKANQGSSLGAKLAMITVVLAAMHDMGFLRRESEAHVPGGALARGHEARAAEHTREYLRGTCLASHAELARLIEATRLGHGLDEFESEPRLLLMARMLATADLTSQLADRYYLEKCRDFLYREFVEAGIACGPDGSNPDAPYSSPEDLLRKTPAFCREHVLDRLDSELGGVHRLFTRHFHGENPYGRAIEGNLAYLREVIDSGDFGRLRRVPVAVLASGVDGPGNMPATVRGVMDRRKLLQATPETTVTKAARLMAVRRVGAIAVVEDKRLVGIFTERDALVRVIARKLDPETTRLDEVMTRMPITVGPEESIDTARSMMRRHGFRHLAVVEGDEPVGMVSSRESAT
jgi:CBS domain-containing protein